MRLNTKNLFQKISIITIIFLFYSSTYLAVASGNIAGIKRNYTSDNLRDKVSIYSFDEDDTIISLEILDLTENLQPYMDVDYESIIDYEDFANSLIENNNDYVVILGHSNENSIAIENEELSWSQFSQITTQFEDKTIILPTCYGYSVYENTDEVTNNIIAPFTGEVDFRISKDITLLTLSMLTDNKQMQEESLEKLVDDIPYYRTPQATLIHKDVTFSTTGSGYHDAGYILDQEIAYNLFIIGGALKEVIIHVIAHALEISVSVAIIIPFLIEVLIFVENWATFYYFWQYTVGYWNFDYCYEEDIYSHYICDYDVLLGGVKLIYYFWQYSYGDFVMWTHKYDVRTTYYPTYTKTTYKRDFCRVCMHVTTVSILEFVIGDIHIGLFDSHNVDWTLESYGTRYFTIIKTIPGGGGGGGGELPF